MMRYNDASRTPPGGFQYRVPETGKFFQAVSLQQLKSEVVAHYRGNNLQVPTLLQEKIEDQDCGRHPERCTHSEMPPEPIRPIKLSDALNFLGVLKNAFNSAVAGDGVLVSKEEATRRGAICRSCPMNVAVEADAGCKTCSVMRTLIDAAQFFSHGRTEHDPFLKNCMVCACFNRAQIWVKKEILVEAMPEEQKGSFPDWCWKKP